MEEIDEFLLKNRVVLVDNLKPKRFYTYLRSKMIIDQSDEEEIEHRVTTREKVGKEEVVWSAVYSEIILMNNTD